MSAVCLSPEVRCEQLTVLHEDACLLAFDKPSGLLSVPGRGPDKQDCLSTRAQKAFPDALIVHRLDMATSGLLLMARGADMQRVLSRAFAQRQVHKRYAAIVSGHLPDTGKDWQQIDLPILLDWPRRPLHIVDPAGKPSLTRWRVAGHLQGPDGSAATRLELEPVSGRSHQLRVHLQAIGHPILGDPLYTDQACGWNAPRLLLHACQIGLQHPMTGQWLQLSCPAPF